MKRHAAKSPDLAQILKALRPVLTDFVGEVQRSLGYFTNTHRDAHVAYMVGLGSAFKLPGLQKYLSEKLSLEVKKPTRIDGVAGETVLTDPVFLENALTFPVAYGLALQGLASLEADPDQQKKYALLRTNLLPSEIHVDRMIRAKKPWAAATAASLLLGVSALAMGQGCQYGSATDANLRKAIADAKQAAKDSGDRETAYKAKDTEVKAKHAEVKALVAGNEERLNWVRLHEVIATAMPRPPMYAPKDGKLDWLYGPDGKTPVDVGNLTLPARDAGVKDKEAWRAQAEYLALEDAADAIARYTQRVRAGVPADRLYDNTKVELLPLVNVESIDCRWTDNLQQFLDNANAQAKKEYGLNVVGDLLDERAIKLKVKVKDGDGKVEEKEEELKLAAEREASETPNARPVAPWHKFNPKGPAGAGWVVEVRGYTYHTDGYDFVRYTLVRNLQEAGTKFAQDTDPTKVGRIIPDLNDPKKDPVLGKVSHAFLYAQKVTKANDPNRKDQAIALTLAATSQLDKLIGGAPATTDTTDGGTPGVPPSGGPSGSALSGGPGGSPGGYPGPGGPGGLGGSAGGWAGLIRGGSSTSLTGSYFGSGSTGEEDRGGFERGGPGVGPGIGPGVGPGVPAPPANAKNTKQLTEFVVYFIWMEPSATDPAAEK